MLIGGGFDTGTVDVDVTRMGRYLPAFLPLCTNSLWFRARCPWMLHLYGKAGPVISCHWHDRKEIKSYLLNCSFVVPLFKDWPQSQIVIEGFAA